MATPNHYQLLRASLPKRISVITTNMPLRTMRAPRIMMFCKTLMRSCVPLQHPHHCVFWILAAALGVTYKP
jgi:hypothetical protein